MIDAPKYKVDGTSSFQGEDGGTKYAIWRVVRVDNNQLICAFFGGASHHAAYTFCEVINNDPAWNLTDD